MLVEGKLKVIFLFLFDQEGLLLRLSGCSYPLCWPLVKFFLQGEGLLALLVLPLKQLERDVRDLVDKKNNIITRRFDVRNFLSPLNRVSQLYVSLLKPIKVLLGKEKLA